MPFKQEIYDKYGNVIDACPFIFGVDLDELETNNCATLTLKPLDPCVVIARYYYERNESEIDPHDFDRVEKFTTPFFYNDEDDELILNVFNGFDVALFNICSLLNIGQIELADEVPYNEHGFAPIDDKVRLLKFTLEEFKQLDGFVAWFKFAPPFILFKGLVIGANYIHEDVKDGDVPFFRNENLQRGENAFLLD